MNENKNIIRIFRIKQRLIAYDILYEKFLKNMDKILKNFKFTFLVMIIKHLITKINIPKTNINI